VGVGLEVRVPLLDHRVVEYTSGVPDGLKYRNWKGSHQYRLWALLMWEMWRERWLE